MPVGATIGAVGSLGSALIGSNAASSAASAQVSADEMAQQTQLQMYDQTRQDLSPYRETGRSALQSIAGLYGLAGSGKNGTPGTQNFSAFTNSPDYSFALQQGNQAVNATAAANGQLMSGGQVAAAQQFGQGLASQQFSNYFNRLLSLSGLGESAASQTASANQSAANSLSSLQQSQGASTASGIVGSSNALTSGLNSLGSYAMLGRIGSSYGSGSGAASSVAPNSLGLGALTSLGSSSGLLGQIGL